MRRLLFLLFAISALTTLCAQERIRVLDDQGYPVSFAIVRNEQGVSMGSTDIDGYLPALGDAKTISLSHVGYEPKKVRVASIRENRIKLETSNFYLQQVKVTADKPVIRIRAFFRTYADDAAELVVYHSGLVDFYINPARDDESHELLSEIKYVHRDYKNEYNAVPFTSLGTFSMIEAIKRSPEFEVADTTDPLLQVIFVDGKRVGTLIRDTIGEAYRLNIDIVKVRNESKAKRTKQGRVDEIDSEDMWNFVYGMGEDGYVSMSNLLMRHRTDCRKYKYVSGSTEEEWQRNILQDVYVLECEYMTRKDARAKRREKSAKLDYEALEQIRQEHRIPDIDEQLKVQAEQVLQK